VKKRLYGQIIANYLPQYHEITENNMWWGEGYTDWVAVKKAKPLYFGHNQPRVPLENNYYDLSKIKTIKWQAEKALNYGIYGFNIYHYWFSTKQNLLTKPAEIILNNPEINIHYMFTWDNAHWRRSWSRIKEPSNDWAPLYENEKDRNNSPKILAKLDYGKENEWKKHFEYMLPYFKDERYITIDGKPLFGIYNIDNDPATLSAMMDYWQELAHNANLPGIAFIAKKKDGVKCITDYEFIYEPEFTAFRRQYSNNCIDKLMINVRHYISRLVFLPELFDYNTTWKKINCFANECDVENLLYGAFVGYDDSPRRGRKGKILIEENVDAFKKGLECLVSRCNVQKKEYIFLTAWNEWGEGAYLEPDVNNGYRYLDAVKEVVERCSD